MINWRKFFGKILRKTVSGLTVFAVIFSSLGPVIMSVPEARAASVITASTEGLPTQMPGEKISANSFDMPILKISVTASQASQTLQAITANFSGTGFAAADLAAIATGGASGVALYADTNDNGFYNPGGTDAVITLAASPDWTASTTNITLTPATPFSLPNGTAKVFFLVIKTSGTISNGDQIIATIPANGVITSDGNGPAANFSSNYLLADTTPVGISLVSGAVGSNILNVKFSKPVRKAGAGFNPIAFVSASDPFVFTDNGGGAKAVTGVTHTAGQDFVVVTLSGNLTADDLTVGAAPGISTLDVAVNAISDMGGVTVAPSPVNVSNPLNITTPSIPSTIALANHTVTPLVTFAAAGGAGGYTWDVATAADGTTLSNLGLALGASGADAGKLTGTIANIPGSYSVNIKVTDSGAATSTRFFNINVAPSGGGGIPGIDSIIPGGGPKSASAMPITVSGVNTHFSGSSTVQFWKNGANDADITVAGIASGSATNLTFSLTIAAGATEGPRDVKIVTGTEQVMMPNGFGVFSSGGSGLGLLMPSDGATGVQMPPNFNFDPSTDPDINSYRITINTTSNFGGTTLWDYVFPKPADIGNSNNSHCNSFGCNVGFGEGRFMILTPPTPLAPNTTYYWRVRTYREAPASAITSATAEESTAVRGFTTTASMSDVEPPMIQHRPIFQATASANLNVIARVMDNLATATTAPALATSLFYCAGAACSPTTEVAGTSLAAGYYRYVIPSGTVGIAGTIVRYYISATDGTNTRALKQPDGTTPFQLASVAAGSANSITGNVEDMANPTPNELAGAYVFAEGTGFLSDATGVDGNFTLGAGNTLFAGNYDLIAVKDGYGDPMINGIPAGTSAVQFRLGQGFGGGFGGDTAKPRVKFTGPMDGMNGIPGNDTNFKIFVAFDKTMSQSKFTEAGNMLVKKIIDFSSNPPTTANVAGSWVYYSSNPGLPMIPPEGNMAVFTPSEVFGENKTILVSVTSSITDTAGNSIQSNQSDGSYSFMFTTGSNVAFSGNTIVGGTFGTGAFMPPHVNGTMPAPGSFDVPRNSKVIINFSDPMADDGGGYLLENNVKLFTVSGTTETNVTVSSIDTVVLDSTKMSATVTLLGSYNTGTFAASTVYRLKVLGGAKAANGMTIAPPDQAANVMFTAEFKTGTASDVASPSIVGSYPSAGDTNTPVNIGAINVGFSKDMDMSTITTSTVYLSIGATAVNGTMEYRGVERQAFFIPKSALNPNTTYTINVTTDVKGINNVAIAATAGQPLTRTFTTGGADSTPPEIMFMNADDYAVAITFSEPMNTAKATDTLNWSTSVLNPAVYNVIKYGAAGFDPASTGTVAALASATFKYDAASNTLIIEGLALTSGQELYLSMDVTGVPGAGAQIAKDLSGNEIAAPKNAARSPINSSANTKGALGPSAMGGSAFDMGGGFVPTNFSTSTFGFAPPVEVRPFNMMAGKTTIYGIRLPVSSQIPAGGQIVLTFPTGFDVSAAQQDINSPMRSDFNGAMGSGTITFKCQTAAGGTACGGGATVTGDAGGDTTTKGGLADDGVVINSAARTVTVYLSAATNAEGHDFLTIDISGIKNSTVPKDFNTAGYTIDVKTKSADGTTVKESLTSMPFFIQSAGAYALNGTITATGATAGTAKVYLGSPMTGPMEATSSAFIAGSAVYSFTGLVAGEYMLFTDQTVVLTGGEFAGKSMPERIMVNEAADIASGGDDDTIIYNFTLPSNTSGGTNVTVSIDGPANEPLDIFAGSPTGFKVKQVTLNGTAGAENFTINLGNGQWFVGVGPQMPKGMMSGPPPAPNYLPPKPIDVGVSGATVTENSGTANNGTIEFTLTSSDKTIKGVVKDGSATPKVMANAEVYAYSPNGGFGTHTQADSAGNFTLNVVDGSYIVGSFVQGMPPSKEVPVVVNSDPAKGGHAANYLYIDGAATGIAPATAATAFVLKVAKPDYTISGKVTDGTNVAQGASVYAYRNDGPGYTNANTDSSGAYTLYVSAGTWKVGTFLPQYGQLTEQTVTITTSNASNINFSPSQTGTFRNVSGTVTSGVTPVQGAFVKISGNGTFNEAKTGATGTYSFNVPVGTGYVIRAFVPGVGETAPLAAFDVAGADITGKDISVGTTRTITFTFTASVTEAFIDLFSSTGIGNHIKISNTTTGTMTLPDGSYKVRVDVPGMAIGLADIAATDGTTVYSNTTGIVAVNGNEGLTITVPTLRTITGTVTDGTNNIADAWVEIVNTSTGVHFGTMTNSTALGTNFSFKAADGTYYINAMKPGYYREPVELVVDASTAEQTLALSAATKTISGQIFIGASGAANAFVRAEKQGGGFSGTQADATGAYSIPVSSGIWKIYAVAEGYGETAYASNPIDMTTASTATGKNITLSTAVNLSAPKSKPITPSSGGTLEDSTSGVKLTIPANALGSSTSSGNIQSKDTNNVRETGSSKPLKKYDSTNGNYVQAAKEIKATDSSGNAITSLSGDVTVEMTYTKAELANTDSAADSSIDTKVEADSLKMAYWDESTSNWVTKPTTITYKNAVGDVITDATTIDTANEFNATVATVVISAATDHFSLYAPVVSTAGVLAAPAGFAATAASSTQINLSWTAVAGATGYDIYRSASSGGTFARIGSEPTVASGATAAYSDTGLTASTAYYYKITSLNNAGETLPSSEVTATTSAAAAAPSAGGGGGTYTPPATSVTGASISIAGGAASSVASAVILTLAATNATQMAISNASDFAGAVWETFATSKSWVLSAGEGLKTVYVIFKDAAGIASGSVSDTITLGNAVTSTPGPTPAPSSSTSASYPDGTLLRASDAAEVYVIRDGNKVWVKSAEEFNAAGYKWSDVKVVSGEVLKAVGSVKLIRVAGDPRVYVLHNSKKTHVKSAEEFNAAGYKWENIVLVSQAEIDSYAEDGSTSGKKVTITSLWLRVRGSGTINSAELARVNKNESYSVLDEKNGWYKIQTGKGITGWISGAYVSASADNAGVSQGANTVMVKPDYLRIRSVNSTGGKILGLAKKGEIYSVLEETGGWYKIKTSAGANGWVLGTYVTKK